MRSTLIDLFIVIAIIFAVSSGYRRGFWLSLAQYAGLVAGVVVGASLAPVAMNALNLNDPTIRSLVAIMILIVLGTIGSSFGFWVGEPIRLRLLARPRSGRADSLGGAIFSAIAVLSVSWFLGLSLARVPSPALSTAIQRSAILRSLDALAPRPPAFLAQVQGIIAGVNFPSALSGLKPTPSAAVVDGQVRAEGRDIYGQNLVVRSIWIAEADVQPGNSGGPLVNLNGDVVGVIFASSTSNQGRAFALTDAEVQPDIDAAQGQT